MSETASLKIEHPLVHVEWSSTGFDLALVDAVGRVSVISMMLMTINRFNVIRPAADDSEDPLNQAVILYWLNVDRPMPMVLNATKESDRWAHIMTRRRSPGPYWHRGLIVVTRSSLLKLIYQKPDGRWLTQQMALKTPTSADELLSNAAVCSMQDGKLLVAVHDLTNALSVYSVKITFPDLRQDQAVGANIQIDHISSGIDAKLAGPPMSGDVLQADQLLTDLLPQSITHLEIIPTSDIEKAMHLSPVIVAIYSPNVGTAGLTFEGQAGFSVLCRWNVVTTEQKLHPAFADSTIKAGTGTVKRKIERLPDLGMEQIVASFKLIDGGSAVACCSSDGSIRFYNSSSFTPLEMEQEATDVTSMSQSGWIFMSNSNATEVAFSPNACLMAVLDEDSKLQINSTTHLSVNNIDQVPSPDDVNYDSAVAALCLTFARNCYSNTCTDDVLYFISRTFSRAQYPSLLTSLYRSIFRDIDLIASSYPGSDLEKLPQKQMVAKVLSLQAGLGYLAEPDPSVQQIPQKKAPPHRSLLSAAAWTTLNLRYIAMQVYLMLAAAKNGGQEWGSPEILEVVMANIRWALDVFKFIVDELFEVADSIVLNQDGVPTPIFQPDSPTPLLVTHIWSRYFLKTISRVLRGLAGLPKNAAMGQARLEPPILAFYSQIAALIEACPLKMEAFERLMGGADKLSVQAFEAAGLTTDREMADVERELMCTGVVQGTVLEGVMGRLVAEFLPKMRGEDGGVDRLSLWMGRYGWTGLMGGREGTESRSVDVHRKKKITKGMRKEIRQCVRCGGPNLDVNGAPKTFPRFTTQQLLRCICESYCIAVQSEDVLGV